MAGCNPFIRFDRCHLKGPFGGVLLAAIGLDENNGLFPIAFAIPEMECKEHWMFFFENLSNMLKGFSHDRSWTFMSDRQKIVAEPWSRHAFDPMPQNDHMTKNISGPFNHWVGELRGKPMLTLLDGLRAKLLSRLQNRREKALKWSNLLEYVTKKSIELAVLETIQAIFI
ncbi:UNVERIFIED_CONTAM: hypothetical protein Slati_3486500 [Sesamum latifolium]|uniref:MULE transposase domain-containing protein n=1 Tax=Sesamum latifolium TaxID=2727402 RepID=A0AAW2UMH6_9LAMI